MWAQEREELGRDRRPGVGRADRPVADPPEDLIGSHPGTPERGLSARAWQ